MEKNTEKVVITGIGAVTSIGNTVEEYWDSLIKGKCGIRTIRNIPIENHDTTVAAEVDDSFENQLLKSWKKRQLKATTRAVRMGLASASEAIDDSGLDFDKYDTTRIAIIYGVIDTSFEDSERNGMTNIILKDMPSGLSAMLAMKYHIHGAGFSIAAACATSANSVALGKMLIQSGAYDAVIVGGLSGNVCHKFLSGFNQLLAMSANPDPTTASRPFTKNRDGFIMGEGAGTIILESENFAEKRGAKIYCELAGTAMYSEGFHMTAPQTDGAGMIISMESALKDAGISSDEVDYINAHGTSTNLNDLYETMAIKSVFGERAKNIPVSSIKGAIGHTLAAGGALEAIACIKAIETGIIPPTINYDIPDPELNLDYVPNNARVHDANVVLSNSFAFGGRNATLVFRKYDKQKEG